MTKIEEVIDENLPPNKESKEASDLKQYFINDVQFQMLKQCQQEIYVKTEVSPAIRKLVNELINVENLQKIKNRFIAVLSN